MGQNEQYGTHYVEMIYQNINLVLAFMIALIINISCSHLSNQIFYEDPLTAEEHNNLGVAYEKEGKLDLALIEYKKSADKDKSLITPLINMGNIYLKRRDLDSAEKYYLLALDKDEYNINAANNLANVYLERNKNFSKGINYLLKAVEKQEEPSVYALDTLAELYLRTGQLSEVRTILNRLCGRVKKEDPLYEVIQEKIRVVGNIGCK